MSGDQQSEGTQARAAGLEAERAWRDGEILVAIGAADRALAAGVDPDHRAAGVAAAAAAADGSLLEAADRWRGVAAAVEGAAAVWADGRAALAAALAGDVAAAEAGIAAGRARFPEPAPRGLTVLLDGVEATLDAVRGELAGSARRLAGLAAATVPPDPLAVEGWSELAVTVTAAGGDDRTALAMLAARDGGRPAARAVLLAAWLALRAGRLRRARELLGEAAGAPVLRRNAVLAAAVTVGIARRGGDADGLAATWRRAAPVVAGADVEPLLLDVWGELGAGAAKVSAAEADGVADAMADAVARAGCPPWCVAIEQWWRLERAAEAGDAAAVRHVATRLAELEHTRDSSALLDAALTWVAVLAGEVDPAEATRAVSGLAGLGRRHAGAVLCTAAARRAGDPVAVRELLGHSRGLLADGAAGGERAGAGGLSERERAVGALVLDGLTHKEIGARLYISPKTVEQHVARLRQKLGAANRAQLVAALRVNLRTASPS